HDHVGSQGAVLARDMHLFLEVAVRRHARELDEPSQRDLAPLAADLRLAQRLDEIAGLALEGTVAFAHVGQVLAQAAEVALPLDLDLPERFRSAVKRFLDRLDERLDRLFALLERALGSELVPAQVFLGKAQEVLDVLAKLPARQVVETPVEL